MTNPTTHEDQARPPGSGPALRVEAISKSYGVVRALQPTSLELAPGEVHSLVGENGSGKSTLVGIVSGTVTPDSGSVEIGGRACRSHARGSPSATVPSRSSRTAR